MSNLAFVELEPSNEYQDLETLAGIQFVTGTKYLFQIEGSVKLCEKATTPTSNKEGFIWNSIQPFEFNCKGDPVYVRAIMPINGQDVATINIAD